MKFYSFHEFDAFPSRVLFGSRLIKSFVSLWLNNRCFHHFLSFLVRRQFVFGWIKSSLPLSSSFSLLSCHHCLSPSAIYVSATLLPQFSQGLRSSEQNGYQTSPQNACQKRWTIYFVFWNRPRSKYIYQYSSMAQRLSGQTSTFGVVFFASKSLFGIERQRKSRSHGRILI